MEMKNNKNKLRTFMNKQDALEMLRVDTYDEFVSDKDIIFNIQSHYEELIDLRNRIHDESVNYEEDHIILDYILAYIQSFMTLIGMGEIK